MNEEKYFTGQRFVMKGGYTLRIMGIVEGWIVCRFKKSAPFLKHINDFESYLKKQEAQELTLNK